MNWISRKISELRNQSYAVRLKILRNTLIFIGIILVVIWIITLRYRAGSDSDHSVRSKFEPILEGIKNIYEKE